jgi:DNA-binding SARP family transcriptional activator
MPDDIGSGQEPAAETAISIRLLGDFRIHDHDRELALPPSTWRLVAYLALAGHPVTRRHTAHVLWLDKPERRAEANLRSALYRLNRTGLHIVQSDGQLLALTDRVAVDVSSVKEIAGRFWNGQTGCDILELDVDSLLDVELLPDWYDDFVEVERERLRQLVLHVLEAVATERGRRGDTGRALDLTWRAIAAAPWRESAHRLLISLHIAEANIAEAVRHYRYLERLLAEELGVQPSEATTALVTDFLAVAPRVVVNGPVATRRVPHVASAAVVSKLGAPAGSVAAAASTRIPSR